MKVDRHSNQGSPKCETIYQFHVKLPSLKCFPLAVMSWITTSWFLRTIFIRFIIYFASRDLEVILCFKKKEPRGNHKAGLSYSHMLSSVNKFDWRGSIKHHVAGQLTLLLSSVYRALQFLSAHRKKHVWDLNEVDTTVTFRGNGLWLSFKAGSL